MCSRIERARRVCEYHRLIRLRCQSSSAACRPGHCVAAGRGLRTVVDRSFGGKAGLIPACSVIRRRTATGSAAGVERAKGLRPRQRQVIAGASAIARPSPSTWSQLYSGGLSVLPQKIQGRSGCLERHRSRAAMKAAVAIQKSPARKIIMMPQCTRGTRTARLALGSRSRGKRPNGSSCSNRLRGRAGGRHVFVERARYRSAARVVVARETAAATVYRPHAREGRCPNSDLSARSPDLSRGEQKNGRWTPSRTPNT